MDVLCVDVLQHITICIITPSSKKSFFICKVFITSIFILICWLCVCVFVIVEQFDDGSCPFFMFSFQFGVWIWISSTTQRKICDNPNILIQFWIIMKTVHECPFVYEHCDYEHRFWSSLLTSKLLTFIDELRFDCQSIHQNLCFSSLIFMIIVYQYCKTYDHYYYFP